MASLAGDLSLRQLSPAELADFAQLEALVWGWPVYESRARFYAEFLEHGHSWGVFREGRLVASHGLVRLRLTVPGGNVVDAAGMTILAIHPEFRGRGLMSLLTANAHDLIRRDGNEPVAVGVPHHSRTHLRYGYGIAARHSSVELDVHGQRTLSGVNGEGTVEYTDVKTALGEMDQLSQRMTGLRNGWIARKPCASAYQYTAAASPDGDFGPVAFVLHRSAAGDVDGFLSYRLRSGADSFGRPNGGMKVIELFGVSGLAEAQLWQHCLSNPVVTQISAARRPVNEPVAARLPDPRAWRQVTRDDMILRTLDVPRALAARCYGRDDTVTLGISGQAGSHAQATWNAETEAAERPAVFELCGGIDGATCRRVRADPDIGMSLSALGAAYLGDVSLADLAASGQVTENKPGSLRRASCMFSWSPAPWIQDTF
jgi:predicted acetyltransferase